VPYEFENKMSKILDEEDDDRTSTEQGGVASSEAQRFGWLPAGGGHQESTGTRKGGVMGGTSSAKPCSGRLRQHRSVES
jgi:hypothetical protein